MNQHPRLNAHHLPHEVHGDLLHYRNGLGWTRLPIGAANAVLRVVSGLPAWQAVADFFGSPVQIDIGDAAAAGTATTAARSDHQHAFPSPATGYPQDVAAAESDGTATTAARSDHVHAHGSGYLPDAHHAKSHAHDGADGSGTVSHANLTGVTANQHHAQIHGASDHTDRTRQVIIPLTGAAVQAGSPVYAVQGINNRYAAWAFDANTEERIALTWNVPSDYVSNGVFKCAWTNLGAGSGNVRWIVLHKSVAATEDLNTTTGEVGAAATVAAPAQNILAISALSGSFAFAANEVITILTYRDADDAGDTLGNDAGLLHLIFEYTADM